MKSVNFLIAMLTAVVVMASCATTQGAYGDDYERADNARKVGDRVYVDDPYYGTVILEKDPFTGRYYDVTNGYGYRGYRSPYNSTYRGYRGGYYGNYGTNRVYRNNSNVGSTIQKPAPSQPTQKTREEARKKILGN